MAIKGVDECLGVNEQCLVCILFYMVLFSSTQLSSNNLYGLIFVVVSLLVEITFFMRNKNILVY